jgi:hypothetical protein
VHPVSKVLNGASLAGPGTGRGAQAAIQAAWHSLMWSKPRCRRHRPSPNAICLRRTPRATASAELCRRQLQTLFTRWSAGARGLYSAVRNCPIAHGRLKEDAPQNLSRASARNGRAWRAQARRETTLHNSSSCWSLAPKALRENERWTSAGAVGGALDDSRSGAEQPHSLRGVDDVLAPETPSGAETRRQCRDGRRQWHRTGVRSVHNSFESRPGVVRAFPRGPKKWELSLAPTARWACAVAQRILSATCRPPRSARPTLRCLRALISSDIPRDAESGELRFRAPSPCVARNRRAPSTARPPVPNTSMRRRGREWRPSQHATSEARAKHDTS